MVQLWNYSPPEEVFHKVSILTPDRAEEGGGRPLQDGGASCSPEPEATVQEEEEGKEEEEIQEEEEKEEEEEIQEEEEKKEEEKK